MTGCRHILVAFDGAPHSDRALTIAIELARGAHARLTILTATRQVPCPAYTGAATEAVAVLSRTVTSDAERTLCEAVRRVPDDVSVTKVCTHEPIRAAILRRIEEGRTTSSCSARAAGGRSAPPSPPGARAPG